MKTNIAIKKVDKRNRSTPNIIAQGLVGALEFAAAAAVFLPLLLKTFLKLLEPEFELFFVIFFPGLLKGDREFAEGITEFTAETVVVAAEFTAETVVVAAEFTAETVLLATEFTAPNAEFMAFVRVLFIEFAAFVILFNVPVPSVVVPTLNMELILCSG